MKNQISHTQNQYGTHAEWLIAQMGAKGAATVANISDDMTRWLLQCPPRHAVQVYGYRTDAEASAAYKNPIALAQQAGAQSFQETKVHRETLTLLFKVCTRLPGITRHHNPKYLIRDIELLKRRVLLAERLTQRLAEVYKRDKVQVGRQFYHKAVPNELSTIISIIPQPPYLNYPQAVLVNWRNDKDNNTYGLYRELAYFKELTAINGCWRMLPQS